MTESETAFHPAVSIVIPSYNHQQLVMETLDSVFAETFTDYEIIVINDGSPDATAEILAPLVGENRIRYFEQSNRGQGAARNRGLAAARGEFLAYLDDDDLWLPDKLEWQVRELRENPGAVLVYGDHRRFTVRNEPGDKDKFERPSGNVIEAFRKRNWIDSLGQTLIRTSALRQIGGFDESIWGSDDWDLYIRLADLGEFIHRRRTCLLYRLHPANASRRAVHHARNHMKVVRKHLAWNLPLMVKSQRLAASYFVPSLIRCGDDLRREGKFGDAFDSYLHILAFRPEFLARLKFLRRCFACLTRTRPADSPQPLSR